MSRGIQVTSIADGVPFDTNLPSAAPADLGFLLGWNPTSAFWEGRDLAASHRQVFLPEFVTASAAGTFNADLQTNSAVIITGGGAGFSFVMPNATTLEAGRRYEIYNTTAYTIAVKAFGGGALFTLAQNSVAYLFLQANESTAGTWIYWQILASSTASGIINYNIISSTPFSTTTRQPSYAQITGFVVTPQAGTYGVWYNASSYYTTTPKGHWWALYKNAAVVTDSLRRQDTSHSNQTMMDTTMSVISCDGTDTLGVYVSCDNTGTLTIKDRSLLLIRLGP